MIPTAISFTDDVALKKMIDVAWAEGSNIHNAQQKALDSLLLLAQQKQARPVILNSGAVWQQGKNANVIYAYFYECLWITDSLGKDGSANFMSNGQTINLI